MRMTWTDWDLDSMQDAAEAEGHVNLDALAVPVRDVIATLPYYGALSEFAGHIASCADCRDDARPDCPEGVALMDASHTRIAEQARTALSN